jgi:NitT/TauT family transport system permease protein
MDWLIMSIVLLCIMAMVLYAVIEVVEKLYKNRF